jgi:hypothetical protein
VIASFLGAILLVDQNKESRIDKNLLRFGLTDIMFVYALSAIAVVPVKSDGSGEVEHRILA